MLVRLDYVGLGILSASMISHVTCSCRLNNGCTSRKSLLTCMFKNTPLELLVSEKHQRRFICATCTLDSGNRNPNFGLKFGNSSKRNVEAQNLSAIKHISNELDYDQKCHVESAFTNYQDDPMVDKLRTQLGEIHPIPSPINKNVAGLFVFFFFFGILFDKLWTSRKKNKAEAEVRAGIWPQVPTSFSLFLEKDLQRKESVEWVNMVVGKLWKVYKEDLENWVIGLLQPVIDDLKKPNYVERVEIKQFSLGEEPLSVRNVERRTSRGANDLQYQIGIRYTGDARVLLTLKLKFGIIPIFLPVVIRDFDIDGELWVKLRLIKTEPWVGAVSWAFVSLPKIKFELFPFRLFNLMAIPVLSMFLLKLLTVDLPRLFVRPKKIVLDFQKGKSLGPVSDDFNNITVQEGDNKNFVGELSVTLVDARKVPYAFFAKTDPYVILRLGDQEIRSKRNSLTTVIGSPGEPIWNQDFHMLVINPRKQRLNIQVRDSIGFTYITIGTGEVDLGSLQDTVPTDTIVALRGGLLGRSSCGEILLRLTYKAYVEDEDDETAMVEFIDNDVSDDELLDSNAMNAPHGESESGWSVKRETDAFMDVLTALLVSEEFQGIVASDTGNIKTYKDPVKPEPTASQASDRNASSSLPDSEMTNRAFGDSTLLWFAIITGIAVLISLNMGDSGFLNP